MKALHMSKVSSSQPVIGVTNLQLRSILKQEYMSSVPFSREMREYETLYRVGATWLCLHVGIVFAQHPLVKNHL